MVDPKLLWQGDGYANARLAETADGSLLFSRVESNNALFEALVNGAASVDTVSALLPSVDVLQPAPAAITPDVRLEDARQFSLTTAQMRG